MAGLRSTQNDIPTAATSAFARASAAIKGQTVGYLAGQIDDVLNGADVSEIVASNLENAAAFMNSGVERVSSFGKMVQEPESLTEFVGGFLDSNSQMKTWLTGGKTLEQLQKETIRYIGTHYARKNIWYIEIEDDHPPPHTIGHAGLINQFAVDLNYTPWMIQSEGLQVGSLHMDGVSGSERTDIRLTTFDDARGLIQKWFYGKCAQVSNGDGTFGVPRDYLLRFRIRNMALSRESWVHSSTNGISRGKGSTWDDEFLVRPTSIEIDLSRRDQALQELQMTFTQWNTNMQPW